MKLKKFTSILSTFITLSTIFIIGGVLIFINITSDLPSYEQLKNYDPPTITRFYANNGEVISEYANEKRVLIKYHEIPDIVIKAFLAAEDQHFFEHQGIDFLGLARAFLQNIANILDGKRVIGGSTITQQVVKSFLLGNERTVSRKIKEAVLAYRISKIYSKERILELYLNEIFFGNNSYGIYVASQNYFDKEVNELTVADAALLAALLKAPSTLNPFKNYQKAKDRRNWVLKRMQEENFISQKEFIIYINQPIALIRKDDTTRYGETFYSEAVKQQIILMYGENALYEHGLLVNVNLDENIQKVADDTFRNGILSYDKRHGWRGALTNIQINDGKWDKRLESIAIPNGGEKYNIAVVLNVEKHGIEIGFKNKHLGYIRLEQLKWARKCLSNQRVGSVIKDPSQILNNGDVILVSSLKGSKYYALEQIPNVNGAMIILQPRTGKVLGMVGGYNFKNFFNRATQAKRQPGSAFKTFVYLTAFENGFTPQSRVLDAPIKIFQGEHLPLWSPKNFEEDFKGEVDLGTSLAESLNIPTIKLMFNVGIDKVIKRSVELNIYDKKIPKTAFSFALGAFETTLMNITNAYNIIASGGYRTIPLMIDSIYDRKGNLIYTDDSAICNGCETWISSKNTEKNESILPIIAYLREQIIQDDANEMIADALKKVILQGTGRGARSVKKTMGGKTGTTNNNTDAWFIGFSRDLTVGIYIGFDTPRTLGKNEVGATLALPIYTEFMTKVLKNINDGPIAKANDGSVLMISTNSSIEEIDKEAQNHNNDGDRNDKSDTQNDESGIKNVKNIEMQIPHTNNKDINTNDNVEPNIANDISSYEEEY